MSTSENDELLNSLSSRIFSLLVDDLVMDAALQAHRDAAKSRAICASCGTRCSAVRTPTQSGQASPCKASAFSRSGTPSVSNNGANGSSTPNKDGVLYLECVNCQRQIASSRYAPHLSSCMGLNTSRRAAVRGSAKAKQSAERERSLSPIDDGAALSEDSQPLKNKSKSKSKKKDEAEFSLKRKRPTSPQPSPKKPRPKPVASSSISPRFKNPTVPSSQSHVYKQTQSKVPSKLRESSTVSFERDRSSSPETSLGSFRSPPMAHKNASAPWGAVAGKPVGTGPPKRGMNPTQMRAAPAPAPAPVQHFAIDDDEGDETGSSTDSSSSS
ncbi:hypothetical protein BD626DRAFT_500947 [Schizophyllum amplum]|uniref:SAGA-associated factor 11 n=1 Tax=Schizophyllum amplum TaxID=97359 RepID=A0A550C9E5_9AGAR|nr:hypothetical protein BD626DRAFT_500947 [Auriculariopsis ampla]